MRILFMGTPDFAAESLRCLLEAGHEICGVITQPDKPKNRGHKMIPTPVKEFALRHDLPVYQPVSMKAAESLTLVESLQPELSVVVAYGQILPESVLNVPKHGSINVHPSLLPKYRGAAPVDWPVLNGESETGVSVMYMVKRLDAGDVIAVERTPIGPNEDTPALWERLARIGGELLVKTVERIANGTAERMPQDDAEATYAPMLQKEQSAVDWNRSSREIHDQVRGLLRTVRASAELDGRPCKLFRTAPGGETAAAPGTILSADKRGIEVACGDGRSLRILELQGEGGKRMDAASYLNGHPITI